jgi:signal transduction histidine kinase
MTEAHGGHIDFRSSAAEGTTFEVRLPRVSAEVPPSSGEPAGTARAAAR